MNPYIDYPAAAARNSMNSGTMGQLWRPTLEMIDYPESEDFESQRSIVRQHFGTTPPAAFRAASITITGKGFSQAVHIHSEKVARGRPVVLAKDSRGIEHIMFTMKEYTAASEAAKRLASAMIPSRTIAITYSPKPHDKPMSFAARITEAVARAIHAGEYDWPTLMDAELPTLPKGAAWHRPFMSDSFMIEVAGNSISEYQVRSYINKHLLGDDHAV